MLLRWLYNFVFFLAIPLDGLRLLNRSRKMPGAHHHWLQRLAFNLPELSDKPVIWVHAVSLGEVNLSVPFIEALLKQYPAHHILMTTTTLTGFKAIAQHFAERVQRCYFPYDQALVSRHFIQKMKPEKFILIETEIWLNHIRHCGLQKIPVSICNARLSQKSLQGYLKIKGLLQTNVWPAIHAVGAQTAEDAQRFIELGCPAARVKTTGNLKYEIAAQADVFAAAQQLKSSWGEARPVWCAASTHEGEEKIILDVYHQLKKTQSTLLLLLVPRHPQRFDAVATLAQSYPYQMIRRSQSAKADLQTDIYLIDTIGELKTFYAASDVAFVGGSLVEIGGHNIVEAAVYDCAIITGTYTHHFNKIMADFQDADAVTVVVDQAALQTAVARLLADSAYCQQRSTAANVLITQHQGALQQNLLLCR